MNLCAGLALLFLTAGGDGPRAEKADPKPVPLEESIDRFQKAEAGGKDADVTADLVVGEGIRLPLTGLPIRVVTEDDAVVDHSVEVTPAHELALNPKAAGRTKVAVTFGDPKVKARQFVVTIVVRVRAKP
jgi:hypothetical protein